MGLPGGYFQLNKHIKGTGTTGWKAYRTIKHMETKTLFKCLDCGAKFGKKPPRCPECGNLEIQDDFIEFTDGVYTGDLVDGVRSGKGTFVWNDNTRYEGGWLNNVRHGWGECRMSNGGWYAGEWKNDLPNGRGELHWPNGEWYKGDLSNGMRHGYGENHFANGEWHKGEYQNNVRIGPGEYHYLNGNVFRGEYLNNNPFNGSTFFPDSNVKVGDFINGFWRSAW